MLLEKLRKEVLEAAVSLLKYGLVTLTGGNVSGRDAATGYIAITPSGMPYETLSPEDIVIIDIEGNIIEGKWKASVDTPDHLYIYKHRLDLFSIIHTHSTYACCFAMLHKEIPCATTTLANEVGGSVPVAKYAPVNSGLIGPSVVEVIGNKSGCLLANHGVMTVGTTIKHALTAAVMLEDNAKSYLFAKSIGEPVLIEEEEIQKAVDVFKYIYGQKQVGAV